MAGKIINMDRVAENIAALYGAENLGWGTLSDGRILFLREEDGEEYESILTVEETKEFDY